MKGKNGSQNALLSFGITKRARLLYSARQPRLVELRNALFMQHTVTDTECAFRGVEEVKVVWQTFAIKFWGYSNCKLYLVCTMHTSNNHIVLFDVIISIRVICALRDYLY